MAKRILVIHPQRHIARLVEVNLERHGYEVGVAHCASESWTQIQSNRPDGILIAEDVPGLIYQSLEYELRTDPSTSDIPIMAVP